MKEKYLLSTMILLVFLILFTATSLALTPGDFGSEGDGLPDGCVNSEDLEILTMAYGSTPSDSNWNPSCDIAGPDDKLTSDGVIDFEDLMVFAMHYGECEEETSQSLISISNSAVFDGKTVIDSGEHTITVRFPAPIRVFIANFTVIESGVRNFWGIPSNACEILMSTADGKTYTGTADFGEINCSEEWIYILTGDSCCPVIYSMTVKVDTEAPYVDLQVVVKECDTICDEEYAIIITSNKCPYVDPVDPCCEPSDCGDTCTALDEWTIKVYDEQPFKKDTCGECVENACVIPIAEELLGVGCPIDLDVFSCFGFDDWIDLVGIYYVVLTAEDIVSNPLTNYYILGVGVANPTDVDRLTSHGVYLHYLHDADLDTDDCIIKLVNIGQET